MRERRVGGGEVIEGSVVEWEDGRARSMLCLLVCVRARVRAPAMDVVGVVGRELWGVVLIRLEREATRVSWMRRKGRYLFASLVETEGPEKEWSPISVLDSLGSGASW